jgi:hypothetical protein
MRYSGLHSIAGINMEWQKGDVVSLYDGYDKSEECVWILNVSKAIDKKSKSNYYKVYNINHGTTYSTFLDGGGSGIVYSLVSRKND